MKPKPKQFQTYIIFKVLAYYVKIKVTVHFFFIVFLYVGATDIMAFNPKDLNKKYPTKKNYIQTTIGERVDVDK